MFSEHEKVDDMFRFSIELGPQNEVLSSYADGAGVQVTLLHNRVTHERGSTETELINSLESDHDDIKTSPELTISLDDDS